MESAHKIECSVCTYLVVPRIMYSHRKSLVTFFSKRQSLGDLIFNFFLALAVKMIAERHKNLCTKKMW